MTKRIYQHRTAAEHYMQAQIFLANAGLSLSRPEYAALHLQAAQVHATLATASIEPTIDSVRGPSSVSKHSISRFRSDMETLGLNPDEWELDEYEKALSADYGTED